MLQYFIHIKRKYRVLGGFYFEYRNDNLSRSPRSPHWNMRGLYFFGKKAEKKQAEQKEQMDAVAQTVSMLVIDKKRLKLKEAGLPAAVVENTPKYLRRTRVPIVKAKIGPKIMTLMCEEKVFEVLPVKKEAKVVLSGIYITGIKSVRGGIPGVAKKKKKGLFSRFKKEKN